MADEINNLVLEHLRYIRTRVDSMDERMGRLEIRFGLIEGQIAHSHVADASQNLEIDRIKARVDRIERRLELSAQAT